MLARRIFDQLASGLREHPVTLLLGARQTGKTTLARRLVKEGIATNFVSLDNETELAAAVSDPTGFIAGQPAGTVIDEVQRAPKLLLAIKADVDADRQAGRFLLTGSADIFFLPQVADSLAGRMRIHTLWPLSQGEIAGNTEQFLNILLEEDTFEHFQPGGEARKKTIERACVGGFPVAVNSPSERVRAEWFEDYASAVIRRDVQELANIEKMHELPRLFSVVAARSAGLLNNADVARSLQLPQSTLLRYMVLLEQLFLIRRVPAWHSNIGLRLVKSPKLLISDSGLLTHLAGYDRGRLEAEPQLFGHVFETFVGMELIKQVNFAASGLGLFHFRTHKGLEVDYLVERRNGDLAGIEVKASQTVSESDFRGLRRLAEISDSNFRCGVVLYCGDKVVPFGRKLWALPVSALWQ